MSYLLHKKINSMRKKRTPSKLDKFGWKDAILIVWLLIIVAFLVKG